jgi:transcriptional regulator with XRE-family HTH domain
MTRDEVLVLAGRLRELRRVCFGEHGGPLLAERLGLPPRTWANYEQGVMIPGTVILKLIDATGVSPHWLLTGQGVRSDRRGRARRGVGSLPVHRAGDVVETRRPDRGR